MVSNETGCVYAERSFTLGVFESIANPALTIVAVGAHYPQTLNASTGAYTAATATLAAVIKAHTVNLTNPRVILMADTNTEGPVAAAASPAHNGVNKTNGELLHDLGQWPTPAVNPPSAPLFNGCCGGETPPFAWEGDRIVANFGSYPATTVLFEPVPDWAVFPNSEFHKGVILSLKL